MKVAYPGLAAHPDHALLARIRNTTGTYGYVEVLIGLCRGINRLFGDAHRPGTSKRVEESFVIYSVCGAKYVHTEK